MWSLCEWGGYEEEECHYDDDGGDDDDDNDDDNDDDGDDDRNSVDAQQKAIRLTPQHNRINDDAGVTGVEDYDD